MINEIRDPLAPFFEMIAAHRQKLAPFFEMIEVAEKMRASRLSLTPRATRNEIVVVTMRDGRDETAPLIAGAIPAMSPALA
jgi:hypothetical protein